MHNSKKTHTDSTPAKKTPPVTPNANPHDEDTIKSLTARTDMLEMEVLELEGVQELTRNAVSLPDPSKKSTIFSNTNACIIALLFLMTLYGALKCFLILTSKNNTNF